MHEINELVLQARSIVYSNFFLIENSYEKQRYANENLFSTDSTNKFVTDSVDEFGENSFQIHMADV